MDRIKEPIKFGRILLYLMVSFLLGALFPILATIAPLLKFGLALTVDNFIRTQVETPVLWIFDLIPVFAAYLTGAIIRRQNQLRILAHRLTTEIEESTSKMSLQRNYFESLYENIPAPVVTLNRDQLIQTCNPAFEELFGYKKEEILNKKLDLLITDEKNYNEAQKITWKILGGRSVEAQGIRKKKDRSLIEVDIKGVPIIIDGQQVGSLAIYNNVTEKNKLERELKDSMKNLEVMATRDSLTDLLNRRAINEYAESELERAKREKTNICYALIDMDNLKEVNDHFGHLIGDEALKTIGSTIKNSCRIYDKVGRWGGDEFLVIFSQKKQEDWIYFSERIKNEINNNLLIVSQSRKIKIDVCMGVACYSPMDGEKITAEELLHRADKALYKAKKSGRNQVCLYSEN
jgi:diguanylate cyclase (GGDEF)-like protein/PAS domain S-box-containing protein